MYAEDSKFQAKLTGFEAARWGYRRDRDTNDIVKDVFDGELPPGWVDSPARVDAILEEPEPRDETNPDFHGMSKRGLKEFASLNMGMHGLDVSMTKASMEELIEVAWLFKRAEAGDTHAVGRLLREDRAFYDEDDELRPVKPDENEDDDKVDDDGGGGDNPPPVPGSASTDDPGTDQTGGEGGGEPAPNSPPPMDNINPGPAGPEGAEGPTGDALGAAPSNPEGSGPTTSDNGGAAVQD